MTPTKWFHGTDAVLSPKDRLVPGCEIGKDNFKGMDNSWGVWVTKCRELASRYGANVYEVVPEGTIVDWAAENGWERSAENDEFVCEVATVSGVCV